MHRKYQQLTLVLHDYVLHYQAHSKRNKMQDLKNNIKSQKHKVNDRQIIILITELESILN